MKLSARNLGWTTGGKTIVDGVTLEILPGETFGLVGPNGSGKSTLLRLLTGLLPHPSGQVHLEGVPLDRMSRRDIARRIAVVEQMADTSEALRVRDAVELGRTPWLSALAPFGPEDRRIVREALEATGLADMAEHGWSTLSGGERQRAWIAMLLAQKTRCLLLDEPISALDVKHQVETLRLVHRLAEERDLTVIVVLHDVDLAARFCDRLVALRGGQLIADGSPQEVMTSGTLETIYGVPMGVMERAPGQWVSYVH